jgi:hypothetical protein
MEQRISKCSVEQHLRPVVTDHFPIITVIDIEPECVTHAPKHNYHATDWEEFREYLANKLSNIPPPNELTTHAQFQEALTALTRCISETVEAKVPKSNPSPYAKRWWSKELEAERKGVRKLARDSRKHLARQNNPVHEEYRAARNKLAENIKQAKTDHWNEWMESLTPKGIWTFHKYTASTPTDQIHTRIKMLQDQQADGQNGATQDNAQKQTVI